jgi:hypothetical protein
MRHHRRYLLAAAWGTMATLGACDGGSGTSLEAGRGPAPESISGPVCWTLDFETDGAGAPIAPGQIVEDAYRSRGVTIDVDTTAKGGKPGLGVAFDATAPTGDDDDLLFPEQGNVLINQEHFDRDDIAAGRVEEPDDQACGARFSLCFESPVCVTGLTILDIDEGEDPVIIDLFDADGTHTLRHSVPPVGNGERVEVTLPAQEDCTTVRAVVRLSGSGAIDDIVVCDRADEEEEVRWTTTIDEGGSENATSIDVAPSGQVVLGGFRDDGGDADGLVWLLDADGNPVWSRETDAGDADTIEGVAADTDGNVIAVGATGDGGAQDIFVRKYTADGDEVWTRTFDGGDVDIALDADVGPGGVIAVTGVVFTATGTDTWIRLYDADGATLWTRQIDNGSDDAGRGVAVATDGRVAVAGQSGGGGDLNAALYVLDASGEDVFTEVFDDSVFEVANAVAVDAEGNLAVAGSILFADSDAFVRSLDRDGSPRWGRSFDSGAGDDAARGVAVTSTGNLIVHGFIATGGVDIWTQTYGPDGTELSAQIFDNGGAEVGTGVAVAADDSVVVSGFLQGVGGLDAWARAFAP